MKKKYIRTALGILVLCFSLITRGASQAPIKTDSKQLGKYCSVLRDGTMTLVKDGTVNTEEITLKDGSKLTKDGTVKRKDGSIVTLKNGDCIDIEGTIENIPLEKTEQKNNITNKRKPQ
jgi:hypothetical protein